jgi:uncharacterized protein (TIGR02284 family)
MLTLEDPRVTDAAELQNVLTRYIDSHEGYKQAAAVVESPTLAAAFLEIAERRHLIAQQVTTLIVNQGEKADVDGSPEAAIHRWWMRIRAMMTDEEFRAILAECVRGERELARTVRDALTHGNLETRHASVISEVFTEVKKAIRTFQSVLNR